MKRVLDGKTVSRLCALVRVRGGCEDASLSGQGRRVRCSYSPAGLACGLCTIRDEAGA